MRKRTRYKRTGLGLNKLSFVFVVLSVIIVLCTFLSPQRESENAKESASQAVYAEPSKGNTEKNKSEFQSTSNIFTSGVSDIQLAEKRAEEALPSAANDGNIITEDYSFKNATASVGNIYIRNTTKEHNVNIEHYLNKNIVASIKNKNEPTVLIYHTHTSESYQAVDAGFYSDSLVAPPETLGVVRAGDALCDVLRKSGYTVLHDKMVYDTTYSGAFERSREAVSKILRDNPSVQIVIDLHRDSISRKDGSKIKTATEIDGKSVAQIEIIAGCEDGLVTGFPNWEKNLTFALHLQKAICEDSPSAVRPLLFTARKYNMDLVPCAVNVNIGTEANTVREAVYSAEILGKGIAKILKECENSE